MRIPPSSSITSSCTISDATPSLLKSLLDGRAGLDNLSFKYGGNIINPNLKPNKLPKINMQLIYGDITLSSSVDHGKSSSSLRNLFKSESASLIIPKFYVKYPQSIPQFYMKYPQSVEVYPLANRLLLPGASLLDLNFEKSRLNEDLNVGIWLEDFNCNLLEVFEDVKKRHKEAKNIVVYHGTNTVKAKRIFINPYVDAIVFSSHVNSKFINSLMKGEANLKDIVFKYGGNLINVEQFKQKEDTKAPIPSTPDMHLALIDPLKWHSASWNRFGPAIWRGDEQYSQGLALAFGDD